MATVKDMGGGGAPPKGKGSGKRIAGLPLYIWIGAAAGGLLLGLWLRSRSKASGSAYPTPTYDASGAVPTDFGNLTGALAGQGIAPSSPGVDPQLLGDLLAGQSATVTELAASGESAAIQAQANALGLLGDTVGTLLNMPSSGGSGASYAGKTVDAPIQTSTKPAAVAPKPAPKAPTKAAAKPAAHPAPKPRPKSPAPKPLSGYAQKSKANLH